MSRGSTPISGSPEEVAELRVLGKAQAQDALLEAAYARVKELMAEADKEAARWQERISALIVDAGLTLIDPSGNESGDPLDWTADQVAAALGEALVAARETATQGPAVGHCGETACVTMTVCRCDCTQCELMRAGA